ncbi:unnamed protein product [Schistosoma spindalis]|nr:unnamed protein product [Schistosoma spindale]
MNNLKLLLLLFYISFLFYFHYFIQSTMTYTIEQSSVNHIYIKLKDIEEQNNLWKNKLNHENQSQLFMISPVRPGVWKKSKRNNKHKRNKNRRKLNRQKKIIRYL